MNCNVCGKEIYLKNHITFCRFCGARIDLGQTILHGERKHHFKRAFFIVLGLIAVLAFVVTKYYKPKTYSPNELLTKFGDAIVSIHTYDSEGKALGLGSGILVSDDGLVLTNDHVIFDVDLNSSFVKLQSGAYYPISHIYHSDPYYDLATIKIDAKNLKEVSNFLINEKPRVGEKVICIGNPLGLNNSLSEGIVSALRGDDLFENIQTTAPISPGSSGGAMFNENGLLVGITNSTLSAGQNLNFAVPIKYALNQIYSYHLIEKSNVELNAGDVYKFIEMEKVLVDMLDNKMKKVTVQVEPKVSGLMNRKGISREAALRRLFLSSADERSEIVEMMTLAESLKYRNAALDPMIEKYNVLFINRKR